MINLPIPGFVQFVERPDSKPLEGVVTHMFEPDNWLVEWVDGSSFGELHRTDQGLPRPGSGTRIRRITYIAHDHI